MEEEEVRDEAQRQVLELGEMLARSDIQPTGLAAAPLQQALDAYDAACRVLDHAQHLADLAGVLVLIRLGQDAHRAAAAAAQGRRPHPGIPLCFFNPLHGESVRLLNWRPGGQQHVIAVRSCGDCAKRVRRRHEPDALMCHEHLHRRDVPYYEIDPRHSVWAATGYGQLRADLIERVLEGYPQRKDSGR